MPAAWAAGLFFKIVLFLCLKIVVFPKGNRAFADLRYGEEDRISPSTLMFANTKG